MFAAPSQSTANSTATLQIYEDLITASNIPPWECVYFVQGGYQDSKCRNYGKPIKFKMYFIDGELYQKKFQLACEKQSQLSVNNVYPLFLISHNNCMKLSEDITTGCIEKIHEKEVEHNQRYKDTLEPFSRIECGLDIFCFILDTLPISIDAAPLVDDVATALSHDLIDFTFKAESDNELEGFELIKKLVNLQGHWTG